MTKFIFFWKINSGVQKSKIRFHGLKSKCLAGSFGQLKGRIHFPAFPASRNVLIHGPFLHLQSASLWLLLPSSYHLFLFCRQILLYHPLLWIYMITFKWSEKSLSRVRLFATPWTIQSMEFSRPEYWSGQPFLSPGDLPNPGIAPRSPALQVDSLPAQPQGKP